MSDEEQPAFLRPFLGRASAGRGADAASGDESAPMVRAYMMSAGAEGVGDLAFESMVSLSDLGRATMPDLLFERSKIAQLVAEAPQSIAEIAARLRIPLGVSQLLCGDMVASDHLELHQSHKNMSEDVSLLTRLINGVRSL
jgi:hypothetical protein